MKENHINVFIKRSFDRMQKEAAELKTEKGQMNKVIKYFDEMSKYNDSMFPPNIELLEDLKQRCLNVLSKGSK
jgi:hypothetical protein